MLLLYCANRGTRLPNALPNQEEGEPDRIAIFEDSLFVWRIRRQHRDV